MMAHDSMADPKDLPAFAHTSARPWGPRYIAGTCVLLEHGHERQVGSLAYRNDWLAGYMISPTEREREKREKLAAVRAEEVPKYSTTTATTT